MIDKQYYSNYASSHDIDCFFRFGNKAIHFASNGQPIPYFIKRNQNTEVQKEVYKLLHDAKGGYIFDRDRIELIVRELQGDEFEVDLDYDCREGEMERMIHDYAESFVVMAKIGFFSMDLRPNGEFLMIACPVKTEVPDELLALLPQLPKEYYAQIANSFVDFYSQIVAQLVEREGVVRVK